MSAALADEAEAPTKDGSEEEAADKTAGGNMLFDERRTEEVAKGALLLLLINITKQLSQLQTNKHKSDS